MDSLGLFEVETPLGDISNPATEPEAIERSPKTAKLIDRSASSLRFLELAASKRGRCDPARTLRAGGQRPAPTAWRDSLRRTGRQGFPHLTRGRTLITVIVEMCAHGVLAIGKMPRNFDTSRRSRPSLSPHATRFSSGTATKAPLRSNVACRPQANTSLCPSSKSIPRRSTNERRVFNSGR